MTYEQYLTKTRDFKIKVPVPNPYYADELVAELTYHLKTVEKWIDGDINRGRMAEAMQFFGTRYAAKGRIYRGTEKLVFDDKPAAYSKSKDIAEGFAIAEANSHFFFKGKLVYVIERNAPSNSLDFSKLLRDYAEGKIPRADEMEVIVYNTKVGDRNITEVNIKD
jgi:hypothetical protein